MERFQPLFCPEPSGSAPLRTAARTRSPKTAGPPPEVTSDPQPPVPEAQEVLSFEAALNELELVVATLEAGQVPLEESIELLKRGLHLASRCEVTLASAELTLEQLLLTNDGELISQGMSGDRSGGGQRA